MYNLDNDHVLKLFTSGYQDDLAWYSQLKSKVYASDGSVMELHVYDSDDIDIPGRKGATLKFAEMAKLIPFGTFIESTGRSKSRANVDLDNIVYAVTSIYDSYRGDDDNEFFSKVNFYLRKFYKKNRRKALTKQESYQFVRMLKNFIDRGNMPNDMHSGNIGILPQSSPSNPTFVIFDN